MKSTPVRGVKEYLKPYAYKQWEHYVSASAETCVTAYLLHHEPVSYGLWQG